MASISLKELSALISSIELKIAKNSNIEKDVINKLRNIVQSSREDSGEVIVLRNVMKLVVRVYSTVKGMSHEQHGRFSLLFGDCIEYLYDIIKRNVKGYDDLRHDAIDAILVIYKKNNLTQNTLFKSVSNTIMNIVNYDKIKLDVKKDFLKALNFILENTERKLRYKLRNDLKLEKLSKFLYTCGDYDAQVNILETLFRYTSADDRKYYVKKWLPNNELIAAFLAITDFEPDCRLFLNDFNSLLQNNRLVYSLPCLKVIIGNYEIKKPMVINQLEQDPAYKEFWVDFNLGSRSVSIVCSQESLYSNSALANEIVPGMWESILVESHTVNRVTLKKNSLSTDSQEHGYWKMQISFFQPCSMVFSSYPCNFEGNSFVVTFENSLADILHMILQKLYPNNYYYELNEVKRPTLKKYRKSSVTFTISDTESTSTVSCLNKCSVTTENSSKMDQKMNIPQPKKDMVPNDLQTTRSNFNPTVGLKGLPTSILKSKTPVRSFRPLEIVISPSPKKSELNNTERNAATNQTGMKNIVQENFSEDHPQRPEGLKEKNLTAKFSGLPAINKTGISNSSFVKPDSRKKEENICISEANLSKGNKMQDNNFVNINSKLESKKKLIKKRDNTKKNVNKFTSKVEASLQSKSSKQEFHGRVLRSHVKAQNVIPKNNSQINDKVMPSLTHYPTKNQSQKGNNVNIKNVNKMKEASLPKKSYCHNEDVLSVKNDKDTRATGALNAQHSPNHILHTSLPTNLNLSDTDSDTGWLKTKDKKMDKKTVHKRKVQSLGDLHVKLLRNKECATAKEDLKKKDNLKERIEHLETNQNILGKNVTQRLSNKKKLLNLNDQILLVPLTNEKDSMVNNNEIVHDQSFPFISTADLESGKTSLSNFSLFTETGSEPSWLNKTSYKNKTLRSVDGKIAKNDKANQIQDCRIDASKAGLGRTMLKINKEINRCPKNSVKPAKRSFEKDVEDNEEEVGEPRNTKNIRLESTRKKSDREEEFFQINEKVLSKDKNEKSKKLTLINSVQNTCDEIETETKVQNCILNKKQVKFNQLSVIPNSLPITTKDDDARDSFITNKDLIPDENRFGEVLRFSSSKSNLNPSERHKIKDSVKEPMENSSMDRQSQKRKKSDADKIIPHSSKKIKECTVHNEQLLNLSSSSNKCKSLNRSTLVNISHANLDTNLSETNSFSNKSDNDETLLSSEEDSNVIPSSFPENKSNNVSNYSDYNFSSRKISSAKEIPRKLQESEKRDQIMSAKKGSVKKIVSNSSKPQKEVICFEKYKKKYVGNNSLNRQETIDSENCNPKGTASSSTKSKDSNELCQNNSPGKINSSEASIDSLQAKAPVEETQFIQKYLTENSNCTYNLQRLKKKSSPKQHNRTADEIELESMIEDMNITLESEHNSLKRKASNFDSENKGNAYALDFNKTESQKNIEGKSNETSFTKKNKPIESAKLRNTKTKLNALNIHSNDPHIIQSNVRTRAKIMKGISIGNGKVDYEESFIQAEMSSLKDYVKEHLSEKNKKFQKLGNLILKLTEETSKSLTDDKNKIWKETWKKHISKIRKEIDDCEEKIQDLDIIKARFDKGYKYITNTFYIKSEGDMDIKESSTKIENLAKEMMAINECNPLEKFKATVLPKVTLLHNNYLQEEKKKDMKKTLEHIRSLLHL